MTQVYNYLGIYDFFSHQAIIHFSYKNDYWKKLKVIFGFYRWWSFLQVYFHIFPTRRSHVDGGSTVG